VNLERVGEATEQPSSLQKAGAQRKENEVGKERDGAKKEGEREMGKEVEKGKDKDKDREMQEEIWWDERNTPCCGRGCRCIMMRKL
jgi:hypothetical protein